MAGYLDTYGVEDERSQRRIQRLLLWCLVILIAAAGFYFIFRNWRQEQTVKEFLTHLRQKDYQGAYQLWAHSKYYPPEKFIEDWGPSSPYANAAAIKIAHEDTCGTGVVFNLEAPNTPAIGLYVERETNILSFAPWPRCPGKHWQIWEFLRSRFS